MRMQTYRIALTVSTGDRAALPALVKEFEASLAVLHHGDPDRPLFLPWDEEVAQRFAMVESDWKRYRERWTSAPPASIDGLRPTARASAAHIDALVAAIEKHLSRWTALMHLLQTAMMVAAVIGAAVLMFTGYRLVLEPVGELKGAIEGHPGRQLRHARRAQLERRVRHAGRRLQRDGRPPAADVPRPGGQGQREDRAAGGEARAPRGAVRRHRWPRHRAGAWRPDSRAARAAGGARRRGGAALVDETQRRALPDARQRRGLTERMSAAEAVRRRRPVPLRHSRPHGARRARDSAAPRPWRSIAARPAETVVSVPVRLHERVMGEIDLFFHARTRPNRSARCSRRWSAPAGAIENLRLNALAKGGRESRRSASFIARELHDSIAQSLAFLKIQVQLLRDALGSGDAARMGAGGRRDRRRRARELRRRARAADALPQRAAAARTSSRRCRPRCASSSTRAACTPSCRCAATACRCRPTRSCRCCTSCRRRCPTCASTLTRRASG